MGEATRDIHLHDPQTLYRHWEEQQWSPWDIDLATDRGQWRAMGGEARSLILWALSSLMVAEERITTKFAGLVMAYGTEEEATFLATQQVDEARHMQLRALSGRGDRRPGGHRRSLSHARASSSPPPSPRSSTRRSSVRTSGSWPTPQTRGRRSPS